MSCQSFLFRCFIALPNTGIDIATGRQAVQDIIYPISQYSIMSCRPFLFRCFIALPINSIDIARGRQAAIKIISSFSLNSITSERLFLSRCFIAPSNTSLNKAREAGYKRQYILHLTGQYHELETFLVQVFHHASQYNNR